MRSRYQYDLYVVIIVQSLVRGRVARILAKSGNDTPNKPETVVIDDDDDDDDDVIDNEQLKEYQEMVDQLGRFPVCNCNYMGLPSSCCLIFRNLHRIRSRLTVSQWWRKITLIHDSHLLSCMIVFVSLSSPRMYLEIENFHLSMFWIPFSKMSRATSSQSWRRI